VLPFRRRTMIASCVVSTIAAEPIQLSGFAPASS
jgi:hypothetical protein